MAKTEKMKEQLGNSLPVIVKGSVNIILTVNAGSRVFDA